MNYRREDEDLTPLLTTEDKLNEQEKEEVDEEGKKQGQQQQQQGNTFPTPEKLTKKNEPSQVNYNSMHQTTTTPMVNASTPQSAFNPGASELMAANEALGGSFGSMF